MAATDEKVMAMVERELKKDPEISVEQLQKKGAAINSSVSSLTARQFHARYPLQIKRRKAIARKGGSAPKKPRRRRKGATRRKKKTRASGRSTAAPAASASASTSVDRDAVRGSFLTFASELAAAEERKDVVKVLAGVDKYVDQVVKAAGQ